MKNRKSFIVLLALSLTLTGIILLNGCVEKEESVVPKGKVFTVSIPKESYQAFIRMSWGVGKVHDFNLYSPSGEHITPEVAQANPEKYVYVRAGSDSWYAIKKPEAGEWRVEVSEIGLEDIPNPEIYFGNTPPTLTITSPKTEQSLNTGENLVIRWQDEDPDNNAIIDIYYDTDNQGLDGRTITTNIEEDDETDSYIWQIPSNLPTGTYHIYLRIKDGKNAPQSVYSSAVNINNPKSLPAPKGLKISGRNISWNKIPKASGYIIYYKEKLDSPYKHLRGLGDTNQWIIPGDISGSCWFVVSALNENKLEGQKSDSIKVTLSGEPKIETVPVWESWELRFGVCYLGETKQESLKIKNTGNANLSINGELEGSIAFHFVSCPLELSPNEEGTITVKFSPSELGVKTSKLTLKTNDPSNEEITILVRGVGRSLE